MRFEFKDIVWIGIIALVVVLLSRCHRNRSDKLNTDIQALKTKQLQDSIDYQNAVRVYETTAAKADSTAAIYIAKNKDVQLKLDQKSSTILQLSRIIKGAGPVDTSLTTVGPEYIEYCDSLADVSTAMVVDFQKYKRNTNIILQAKDTIISSKDGIIAAERQAKQNCKNDYNSLMHFYQDAQKAAMPRNQLYLGAELIGTPNYLVSNVGAVVSLKTKTNKLWQLSGGLQTTGQYYIRINGNILISLKR